MRYVGLRHGTPILCAWLGFFCVLSLSGSGSYALAQEQVSPTEKSAPSEKPVSPEKAVQTVPLPPGQGDVIYLKDADGRPVPVLNSATLQGYVKWLDEIARNPVEKAPLYGISSLVIEGTADNERARLSVRLGIQIHQDRWVTIPLAMPEAYLLEEPRHEGPGEHSAGDLDAKSGYTWRLKGTGAHVLTLSVTVPLRQVPLNRRVLLTLPQSAFSSLKLTIPTAAAVSPAMERATVQVVPKGNATEIDAKGLGERLDVNWQPQPESTPTTTSLETTTTLFATILDGQTLALDATLNVTPLRGSIDQLRLHLPPGFGAADNPRTQLLWIDGEEAAEARTDPADPLVTVIPLKKSTSAPLVLKWQGTRRLVAGAPLVVEGPQIAQTDLHSGFLGLTVVGDYRSRAVLEADPSVERVSPSSLPPAFRKAQVSTAYRILRQPFRLPLMLQKIEPYTTVEPQGWLHATGETLELDLTWRFQALLGSVTTIRIDWPDRDASKWVVEPLEPPALVESIDEDPKGMLLRLVEPTRGAFQVRLKARRPMTPGQPAKLELPEVTGMKPVPTELVLTAADNLQARVTNSGGQDVPPLPPGTSPRRGVPTDAQKYPHPVYRFDAGKGHFLLQLVPHQRRVTGRTVARLSASRGRLNVAQQFTLDVQYERLAQIRFRLPLTAKTDQVRFFFGNAELVPVVARTADHQQLTVVFDQPRMGPLELEARYRLDDPLAQPGTDAAKLRLPLMTIEEIGLKETRLEWSGQAYDVTMASPAWSRQPSAAEGSLVWSTGTGQEHVDLELKPSANPSLRGAVALRALVRTRVDSEGQLVSVAQYRLTGQVASLEWSLPADVTGVTAWWNEAALLPTQRVEGERATFTLTGSELPGRLGERHLLTIAWQQPGSALQKLGDVRNLPAPVLSKVAVTDFAWDLELPPTHYLLQDPPGFDAQHAWRFQSFAWWRVPNRSPEELSEWIGAVDGPELPPFSASGNRYQFGRLGAAAELSLVTMTGSGLVLLGAGLFAAIGLILMQSSRTRNLLTVLAAAVLLACLGVLAPSVAMVLLQPAAVGICLAIVFSIIQFLIRRRRPDPLSVASGSSYPAPISSLREHPAPPVIGSDENTLVRAPGKDKTPLPAESGSRA